MDISKLKIFNMLQTNMRYLDTKQDLLSQNISNANTPGYVGKTLAPLDFKKILKESENGATAALGKGFRAEKSDDVFEITPVGNKIVIENEIMKVTKNSMEYQQTVSIYRKMMQMMKTAIGDNS